MPLKSETTVEYYFDKAYLYYCKQHDCLRVSNDYEDNVLLNGVKQADVDNFISNYIEYVLEDADLKESFQATASGYSKYKEKAKEEVNE